MRVRAPLRFSVFSVCNAHCLHLMKKVIARNYQLHFVRASFVQIYWIVQFVAIQRVPSAATKKQLPICIRNSSNSAICICIIISVHTSTLINVHFQAANIFWMRICWKRIEHPSIYGHYDSNLQIIWMEITGIWSVFQCKKLLILAWLPVERL